jgi:hypothetical protein
MRLQTIILANKNITNWGKWDTGKMPRIAFPLSKSRNRFYRLGAYRWRVVEFNALGHNFRLLVAYRTDKEQFRATLAMEHDRDMSVLASYEFHGTHPGWHISAACEDMMSVPSGVMRFPGQRRFPAARAFHRRTKFRINNDDDAINLAAKVFNLHKKEGLLL